MSKWKSSFLRKAAIYRSKQRFDNRKHRTYPSIQELAHPMRLRAILMTIVLIMLLVTSTATALAHALLVRSIPEANATLDRAPAQIELFFSEAVDPSFSSIKVLDAQGQAVDNNDSKVDPADPTHLTVSLRSLPDGIYTVSWNTLSEVDSHVTQGSFPFAVGNVDAAALASAAQASKQINVSIGEIIAKWLMYLSAMALTGSVFFILFVWQPAHRAIGREADLHARLFTLLPSLALIVLILADIFGLLVQAGQVAGTEIEAPWSAATYGVLFTTRYGALWIARSIFALALAGLLSKDVTRRGRWIGFGVSLLLLLTISLGSHAAAEPQPTWPVLGDWLHLLAGSIWIGGLIHFVTGLWGIRQRDRSYRTRLTAQLIPRFSSLALISVATLGLTGLYSAILRVGTIDALFNTIYGQALIVKTSLVIPMIMIGAVNLLIITPRIQRDAASNPNSSLGDHFRRIVTSEVTVGIALLLSVGVLTSLPPARVTSTSPELNASAHVDDLDIALDITPGNVGVNTFSIQINASGQPLDNAKSVQLTFTPATASIAPSSVQLIGQGSGQYTTKGAYFSLPATWQVQVAVRRVDHFDSYANFNFDVGTTNASNFAWNRINAVLLFAIALAYMFAFRSIQLTLKQMIAIEVLPALAFVAAGMIVLTITPAAPVNLVNPIPPNAASVAAGKAIYEEKCVPCHGESGQGDGPIGLTLNPRPADLTQHTIPGVHTDGQLFEWITNGFPGSAMPAFRQALSDDDRWNVVNFIRTLAPKS